MSLGFASKNRIMSSMSQRRIALFGGTFNPIHRGHVNLADAAVRECGLDELIFIPNYISPFKQDQKVASGFHRSEMIRRILPNNPKFSLSCYELEKEGPSYTYETLKHFSQVYPDQEIAFVIGYDSLLTIDTWYHGEDILRNYLIITGARPGVSDSECAERIHCYEDRYGSRIFVLAVEPVDAASSNIRELLRNGKSIGEIVPLPVEEYIVENGLYRD